MSRYLVARDCLRRSSRHSGAGTARDCRRGYAMSAWLVRSCRRSRTLTSSSRVSCSIRGRSSSPGGFCRCWKPLCSALDSVTPATRWREGRIRQSHSARLGRSLWTTAFVVRRPRAALSELRCGGHGPPYRRFELLRSGICVAATEDVSDDGDRDFRKIRSRSSRNPTFARNNPDNRKCPEHRPNAYQVQYLPAAIRQPRRRRMNTGRIARS